MLCEAGGVEQKVEVRAGGASEEAYHLFFSRPLTLTLVSQHTLIAALCRCVMRVDVAPRAARALLRLSLLELLQTNNVSLRRAHG